MTKAPSDLLAALEHREAQLAEWAGIRESEILQSEERTAKLRKDLESMRAEQQEVKRLAERYRRGNPTLFGTEAAPEPQMETNGRSLGPSDAIVRIVETARGGSIRMRDVIDRFAEEVGRGHVETNATNPRKLAFGLIPQLARSGRLVRLGKELRLPRKAAREPTQEEEAMT